jgi:hypothetical protein
MSDSNGSRRAIFTSLSAGAVAAFFSTLLAEGFRGDLATGFGFAADFPAGFTAGFAGGLAA